MALPAELTPELITAVYEQFGSFSNPFADLFNTMPNRIIGPKVTYDVVEFNANMSALVSRYGPASRAKAPVRRIVTYEGMSLKEALQLPPEVVDMRRAGSLSESGFQQEVGRAIRQLRLNYDKRKAWMQAQWLTFGSLLSSAGVVPMTAASIDGTVYIDTEMVSDATPQSVTLGITAAHSDASVAASWATSTTDIEGDLNTAAGVVEAATGVWPRLVLMNRQTWRYIMLNDYLEQSMEFADKRAFSRLQTGSGPGYREYELWDFRFRVTNTTFPIRAESMATAAGTQYLIPNNLVAMMPEDNDLGGRYMIECNPSDQNAPQDHRGLWTWQDTDTNHPHATTYGMEWHGGPCLMNPDTNYVFRNVTQT